MVAGVVKELSRAVEADDFTLIARGAAGELLSRRDGELVISGPVFTGKTYPALWKIHLAAAKYPGMRGLFCRKENAALAGSSLVTYRRNVLAALPHYGRLVVPFGGSKLEPPGFRYPNGSFIAVGGVDDRRVMGSEFDLILADEATDLAAGEWEALLTRRRWGAMPYQQLIGAVNPDGPTHWIWQRYSAGTLPLLFSEHRDNPRMHDGTDWTPFGRAYLRDLERSLSGHRRERLLRGRWVAAEGAVYPEFDRRRHVRRLDTTGWDALIAMDVGTGKPTAILTIRFAGDARHIEREVYAPGLGASEIVAAFAAAYRAAGAAFGVVDPSAKGYIVDLRNKGLAVDGADNDVVRGIGVVRAAIKEDRLSIDPSCVATIREVEGYHYPPGSTRDVPEKKDDHCCDAARYGLMALADEPAFVGVL